MLHQLMVQNTPIFFALAVILVGLLAWRFKPDQFRGLRWQSMAIGSALFWSAFAGILLWWAWDFYYSYFAPTWDRFVAPLSAIILYSLLGLLLRWVAVHLPGNPIVSFCLLGGLEALPEHLIAIYRFHILQIPLLQGTAPSALLIFAFFEYVVYWSLALCLVILVDRLMIFTRSKLAQKRLP